MNMLKVVICVMAMLYPSVGYAAFTIHYPLNSVYHTGTPASGVKDLPDSVTFDVYEVEGVYWDQKTYTNPGVEVSGWNVYLTWSYKTSQNATARATSTHPDTIYLTVHT